MDAPLLHRLLLGWHLQLAHAGILTPWIQPEVDPPFNSAWARRSPGEPWCLQVMFEEGTPEHWVCRRHPDVTLPIDDVVRHARDGTPYMAAAPGPRTTPMSPPSSRFSPTAAAWLSDALGRHYPYHPWLD
jgi:hypothetical protein